jgi:hypothetical protein
MAKMEITAKEAARYRMEKRHRELLKAISGIRMPDIQSPDLTPVVDRIDVLTQRMFAQLKEVSRPSIVVEKTEINQTDVVGLLKELNKEVKSLQSTISAPKPKTKLHFDVIRNSGGFISSVEISEE